MLKKPVPIGYEDFKELLDRGCYYVDKTGLIKEMIDTQAKVLLFTRPRRFGKTLNQSMIKYFFEKTKEDNAVLFNDLEISGYDGKYMSYQGKYPVISISLKSLKHSSLEDVYKAFEVIVSDEFKRHISLLDSPLLLDNDKKTIKKIIDMNADSVDVKFSLGFLSECLYKAYEKKVIVLIDEYDVPLENAHFNNFYPQVVDLIRGCFEKVLKTNTSLHMAVLTGCLRVSKESIFTGLNNLDIYDVTDEPFSKYFGFTNDEVESMLCYYDKKDIHDVLKQWYNGYLFGVTEMYNPYSITKAVNNAVRSSRFIPEAYWTNTSSNSIVRDFILHCNDDIRHELEQLVNGGIVYKKIYKDLTYDDLGTSDDPDSMNSEQIWSHLLYTGYLKQRYNFEKSLYELQLPDCEVKEAYTKIINEVFEYKLKTTSRDELFRAVLEGDAEQIELIFKRWIYKSISYHDNKEDFYHGVMLGLLSGFDGYKVKSNRESGDGRFDIVMYDAMMQSVGIIFEFKFTDDMKKLPDKCREALEQIEKNKYETELEDLGVKKVIRYGIAFCKKVCKVSVAK